ncbi:MAG: FeoA family protein [Campylobacterota bacterium]|nr:FeoA family protein [Campylobacterota bacterium]
MKLKQDGSGKGKQLNRRLDGLGKGQKYKIAKLNTDGKLKQKLLDMGFVNGAEIQIVREAPLYDPMELKIHNYNITLRKSEARLIEVKNDE